MTFGISQRTNAIVDTTSQQLLRLDKSIKKKKFNLILIGPIYLFDPFLVSTCARKYKARWLTARTRWTVRIQLASYVTIIRRLPDAHRDAVREARCADALRAGLTIETGATVTIPLTFRTINRSCRYRETTDEYNKDDQSSTHQSFRSRARHFPSSFSCDDTIIH